VTVRFVVGTDAVPPPAILSRVRHAVLAIPAAAFAAGLAALAADARLALLSVAFVLGWTRLVGL
jgi:hypothetical protein